MTYEDRFGASTAPGASFRNLAIITPQDYDAAGDGATDDSDAVLDSLNASDDADVDFLAIPRATYRLDSPQATGVTRARILAGGGATFERGDDTVNLFTFEDGEEIVLEGLRINGRWSETDNNGHGIVFKDPIDCHVRGVHAEDFGGDDVTNGGVAVLMYPVDLVSEVYRPRVTDSLFKGNASEKSFGVIMTNPTYGMIYGSHAEDMSEWGLEFKNEANQSVLAMSTAARCRYGAGIGYEDSTTAEGNVLGLIATTDCDLGVMLGYVEHSVLVGLVSHAEAPPDHPGDGHTYALHLNVESHENVALGVLAYGAAIDYPVLIRGARNVAQVADFSGANDTITFRDGAVGNYVEILHIGDRANPSVVSRINDENLSPVVMDDDSNVIDSPSTRQYFGSRREAFTFYTAIPDAASEAGGLDAGYDFDSTTWFRLVNPPDGATLKDNFMGFAVDATKSAGFRIADASGDRLGELSYVASGSGHYFRVRINSADKVRFDENKIAPVVDDGLTLGNSVFGFADLFLAAGGTVNVAGTKIAGPRDTGWTAGTGTPSKGAFNADTATATQAAQRLLAIEQALLAHGLIGA